VLHAFQASGPSGPVGGVVQDSSGALFGVTFFGGAHGDGTVFKLNGPTVFRVTATSFTTIFTFNVNGTQGNGCLSLIRSPEETLYGTTFTGGTATSDTGGIGSLGLLFALTPTPATNPWTYSVLHAFTASGKQAPANPDGLAFLPFRENYGVSGSTSGAGAVFTWVPQTKKFGAFLLPAPLGFPQSPLLWNSLHRTFFGTTPQGGSNSLGAVFEFS